MSSVDTDIAQFCRKSRVPRENGGGAKGQATEAPSHHAVQDEDPSDELQTMDRSNRYNDTIMPEMNIAAAWVVVMKMAYGLDGRER
jgi:hypothetical protein